jgi:NTE family protein
VLVDGGVVNPVPFEQLEGLADFIIAIDVSGESASGESASGGAELKVPGPVETLLGSFSIMSKVIMEERAKDERIALYRRPPLIGYKIADFLKAKEILDSLRGEAEAFRAELVAAKVDKKAARTRVPPAERK